MDHATSYSSSSIVDRLQASAESLATADVTAMLTTASHLNASSSCLLVASSESRHYTSLQVSRVVSTRLVEFEGIYTAVTQNPFLVSKTSIRPLTT